MKRYLFLLLSIIFSLFVSSQIRMGVITDTHYLSEQLMDDGEALQAYISASGKNIKVTPAVLDEVLNGYLQSDIEVLLVCGDMTKDGEKQSHIDFVKRLKPLQDKGVRIFVVPGNHDINMPNAVGYKGKEKYSAANVSPVEFTDIYADCGYKTALKRDKASLSYVAKLNDKTWLLTIDAAKYKDYKTNSISSGRILPQTEQWVVEVLDEAKAKDIQVIGMMHWGLAEHIIYQSMFFGEYLVNDWQRLAALFADKGMKAIFTGHFHSNDISAFTSDVGNTIYDIETGTLSSYPFAYRFVDLYPDRMDIRTKNIVSLPDYPNLAEDDRQRMKVLAEKMAANKLKRLGFGMSPNVLPKFSEVLSQMFVLHLYGDEKMDEDLKLSMQRLAESMDAPIDLSDTELDFPPADNNVEIAF